MADRTYPSINYTIHKVDPHNPNYSRFAPVSGFKVSKHFASRDLGKKGCVLDHIGTGYAFFGSTFASLDDASEFAKGLEKMDGVLLASANPQEIMDSFPPLVVDLVHRIQAQRANNVTMKHVKQIARELQNGNTR